MLLVYYYHGGEASSPIHPSPSNSIPSFLVFPAPACTPIASTRLRSLPPPHPSESYASPTASLSHLSAASLSAPAMRSGEV